MPYFNLNTINQDLTIKQTFTFVWKSQSVLTSKKDPRVGSVCNMHTNVDYNFAQHALL